LKKLLYCASNNRHLKHFHRPYIKMLEAMGITVHILSKGDASDFPNNSFFNANFEKSILSPKNISVVKAIRKHLQYEKYDYIYLNTSLTAALVRLALPHDLIEKTKVVNLCHGYFFGHDVPRIKNMIYLIIERLLYNRTNHIITMNREDYDYTKQLKLCKDTPFFVHGMGLDQSRYPFSDQISDGSSIHLLYVAEHSGRKNHAELFSALKSALSKGADIQLSLAGDGKLFESNKQRCKSLGLSDHVHFLGYLTDIEKLYPKFDYAVSTSKIEGLPFNIMESLACGLPCISSNIKGSCDLICDGSNGYLYPLGNKDRLAKILLNLEKGTSKHAELKKNACMSIQENTIENTIVEFQTIFNTIFE
jgi:glycosyltransferase EpsD